MTGIKNWLTQLGLHEHDELFRENGVDLDLLPELTNCLLYTSDAADE